MPFRFQAYQEAIAGYKKTGVPLVGFDGQFLKSVGGANDDVGTYYFIPRVTALFDLTLDQGIVLFYGGMLILAWAMAVLFFSIHSKSRFGRSLAVVGFSLLAIISFRLGGLYIVSSAVTFGMIPLILVLTSARRVAPLYYLEAFLVGVAIGTAHAIRSHSGTAVFLFWLILVLLRLEVHWKQKALLLIISVLGVLSPLLYFHGLQNRRDTYLTQNVPHHEPSSRRHPIWHSVYIGFGFLSNPYGIQYKDEIAFEKARSISPQVVINSQEYESIMQREVWAFFREHPIFVLRTLFAKMGIVSLYLLVFANLGLFAAVLYPKAPSLEWAFLGGLAFNSLNGLLVKPDDSYMLGFIACATVYGIVSLNHAIERDAWRRLVEFLTQGIGALRRRRHRKPFGARQ